MHPEILTEKQLTILPYLKGFNRKFYLVGGTAIALYLGHRQSIDYDLFCEKPFAKSYVYSRLNKVPFRKIKLLEDVDQIHFIINEVKMTFFHFPYPIPHGQKINEFLSAPSLLTLAAMKAFALGRRAKWKDYVDMYFILRDYFTVSQIAAEATNRFGDLFSDKLFRQQLAFHADINYSEPVEYLVPAPSEYEIKQFLIDKAIEISL
jgi:hypothetical protein